ncbi:MAG TPA: DEAD/DEAH box helicase family protein [Ruminococcus sp.]|nr:DEAD/DEAH box helicase family protein [Ruminococcus sp.]
MGFLNIDIKSEYRSRLDNVIKDFYVPVLKQAVLYKRAVGFFSSTALVEMSAGICGLVKNGGKIQLIASPHLSANDIEAINNGLKRRDVVIEEALIRQLSEPIGAEETARLNLLSNLIAAGVLEIKIAFLETDNTVGMFHEKMGLMYDNDQNIIAFSGSMNESFNAFRQNYEAVDVFTSWTSDENRVMAKQAAFNAMWNDYEPSIRVRDFPKVADLIIKKYRTDNNTDLSLDEKSFDAESNDESFATKADNGPHIPSKVKMRPYQIEAINSWAEKDYRGIFDMATGTGKTYTALAAIATLYKATSNNLAVFIVCPYQHLVEQWKDDIVAFGMKPIVCYSASSQRNWKERLKTAATSFNIGVQNHFCIVTTNATFSSDYVQGIVKKMRGNVLLVVDEAHNFGAENLSTTLMDNMKYRLALSATIDRHGDPEGTSKLYAYFGEKCIEYTLKDAIDNKMLTPYYYYPVVVSLSETELEEYLDLTAKIRKNIHPDKRGKVVLSEYAKMLLIKRARLVSGAVEKIDVLRGLMQDYKDDNHMLVYCGATTMHDVDYKEGKAHADDIRQIDLVADLLGNELGMRVSKFTSEEDAAERERIKADFDEGEHLQAVVAIRCLDEGVNIPSIKTAFILASSTNPKEYVQRRGRVLRLFKGKTHAVIYDFITLPFALELTNQVEPEVLESGKSLALREIVRMKDFAAIAENPFDSDDLISQIQSAYGIEFDTEDLEDEDYV